MDKLSIITINLNNAFGLRKTIESVINQVYNGYEFIIIDGGSTDGSLEVIKEFSKKITYWVSEPDKGIYNAMNKGIVKATGEYCYFLNSGDYLIGNNILEEVLGKNFNEDIVCFNIVVIAGNKTHKVSGPAKSNITFFDIFGQWCHQALFMKLKLFHEFGLYDETYKISSDWVFLLKVLGLNNSTFNYYDISICCFDSKGISSYSNLWAIERNRAIEKHVPSRILKDYQTGYFHILYRLKKYKLTWILFRLLNKIVVLFERSLGIS